MTAIALISSSHQATAAEQRIIGLKSDTHYLSTRCKACSIWQRRIRLRSRTSRVPDHVRGPDTQHCSQVHRDCSLQVELVRSRLFPSGPAAGGYAYDFDVLNMYLAMSCRSSLSVQAMAGALHEHLRRNGHVLRGKSVRSPNC